MQDHLEHRLMLKTQPKHRSLYDWAIIEVDDEGHQIGEDQIPWPWNLYFEVTSYEMIDITEFKEEYNEHEKADSVRDRSFLRLRIRPENDSGSTNRRSEIHYSMFGTDRYIDKFQLDIFPLKDASEQERCFAWGVASYSYETDFSSEIEHDTVIFSLHINAERFYRYQEIIPTGQISRMNFRVGSVKGFYSAWSPGISTSRIKVLTAGQQQSVIRADNDVEPHRLGIITDAQFSVVRGFELIATKENNKDDA